MPRRLPVRPAKVVGNLFVIFVLLIISLIYYTYVFVIFGPRSASKFAFHKLIFIRQPRCKRHTRFLSSLFHFDDLVILPVNDH